MEKKGPGLCVLAHRPMQAGMASFVERTSPGLRIRRRPCQEMFYKEKAMNEDQVRGRIAEVKGILKEAVGKVVGSKKMEKKGKVKKLKGLVQAEFGDAREEIKKAL